MSIHIKVRGFARQAPEFEETITLEESQIRALIPSLALKHAKRLASHELHMIEIEFLDEPNPRERFFRIGTDPAGMVAPEPIHRWIEKYPHSPICKKCGLVDSHPIHAFN